MTADETKFEFEAVPMQLSSIPLMPGIDMGQPLMKALYPPKPEQSLASSGAAPSGTGVIHHPFDIALANRMTDLSPYHGSCQRTLVAFTCGMGIGIVDEEETKRRRAESKVNGNTDPASLLPVIDEEATATFYEFFDDICEHGFDHVITQMVTNHYGVGMGYLEGARGTQGGPLNGLWWLPADQMWKYQVTANDEEAFVWMFSPDGVNSFASSNNSVGSTKYFRRWNQDVPENTPFTDKMHPHMVLDFMMPTTRWQHYGCPLWLAGIPYIEVDWRALQRVSDYMHNKGVPETIVVIGGARITPQQQAEVRNALSSGGNSNYGRGALLFFPNATKDRLVAEFHQLSSSLEGSGWAETHSAVNLCVSSANQVPPVLAGITTPGKMAASNETVLAMVTLQSSVVGPNQRYLGQRLSKCLLGRKCGGPPGLAGRKLRFRTVLESSDIVALNTVARQREQVTDDKGRDPKEGLKRG